MDSDLDNALAVSPTVKYTAPNNNQLQSDCKLPDKAEYAHDQFEQSLSTESVGSVCSQHMDHDDEAYSMLSSSPLVSKFHLTSSCSPIHNGTNLAQANSDL